MKKIKRTKKIVIITIILIILIASISVLTYKIFTVNNQYMIHEKDLQIPIFLYHHIVKKESEIQYEYMQTTEETFEKQIKGLKELGYHFISYEDLVQYKEGNKPLYKNSCLLTFDDGCDDVYYNAYPIMKKYEVPFTMFVITDSIERDGSVTWEQLKEMQDSGLGLIASHSTMHIEFDKLTPEETLQDVELSYEIIEEKLGKQKIKVFAYPYGLYKDEQLSKLSENGYIVNLTDNKINKSNKLELTELHRCYPLSDSLLKMKMKIIYRDIRYNGII